MTPTFTTFLILMTAFGCSGFDAGKKKNTDTADTETTQSDSADEELTTANEPIQVSGAFLSCVSLDTSETYHVSQDSSVFGCDVKNEAGDRVKVKPTSSKVKITLKDGTILTPVSSGASTENAPFQIYFSVGKSITDNISSLKVNAVTVEGNPLEIEQSFILKHISDQEYLASTYVEGILYDLLGGQINKMEPMAQTIPVIPADTKHLLFGTQKVYPPNVGVAGADALCTLAGNRIDNKRQWLALISTSTQHARDRLVINGVVYNVMAERIAANATEFWSGKLQNSVKFSEFGENFSEYIIKSLKYKMSRVWTGSRPDGTYNPDKGTCLDWTVDAFEIGAGLGSAEKADLEWVDKKDDVPCSHLGRFYCISK